MKNIKELSVKELVTRRHNLAEDLIDTKDWKNEMITEQIIKINTELKRRQNVERNNTASDK